MKKNLPVGNSNFNKIIENDLYFVDKSFLIKNIVDSKSEVLLFTRPRRFGKTLNMNMLKSFFEIENAEKNKKCFQELAISSAGEKYAELQGKYPVIFLSFKDIKFTNWEDSFYDFKAIIRAETAKFQYLLTSNSIADFEKNYFSKILSNTAPDEDYRRFLISMSSALCRHHGVPAILLIDEYDTPIQQSFQHGYYDKMIDFMRVFLGCALKDNSNLYFAALTGILRVSKESIFSGLNNLKVNTVIDDEYSEYFGFTQREVDEMAEYYDSADKLPEIKEWYDGYKFGSLDIYNPWSVLNYFKHKCKAQPYWVNTSGNEIIIDLLKKLSERDIENLSKLLKGDIVESTIETNTIYRDIMQNRVSIFSFLLMTGYLKTVGSDNSPRRPLYRLQIPNMEIECVYDDEIIRYTEQILENDYFVNIVDEIKNGETAKFRKNLERIISGCMSFYDSHENFYHGFMIGITALMNKYYIAKSNRESGSGRFDLAFFPRKNNCPPIVMEFKTCEKPENLIETASDALRQIDTKKYESELSENSEFETVKYGIAFCGKNISITSNID